MLVGSIYSCGASIIPEHPFQTAPAFNMIAGPAFVSRLGKEQDVSFSPDDSIRSENAQGTQSTLVGASSHRIESASSGIPVLPSGPTFPRMRSDLESSAEAAVVPRLHREGSIEIRRRTSCRSHAVDTAGPEARPYRVRSDCERPVSS